MESLAGRPRSFPVFPRATSFVLSTKEHEITMALSFLAFHTNQSQLICNMHLKMKIVQ